MTSTSEKTLGSLTTDSASTGVDPAVVTNGCGSDEGDAEDTRSHIGEQPADGTSSWINRAWEFRSSDGFLAMVDQAIVSAGNFFTNVLVARACSKEDFGVFVLALSMLYFVRGIQEQLISATYTVYRHRRTGVEADRYSGSSLIHQIVLSLLMTTVIGGIALALVGTDVSDRLIDALKVLLCVTPFFLFREFVRKYAFANFQFRTAILLDVICIGIQLIGLMLLLAAHKVSPISVYVVVAVACGASCLWWCLTRLPRFEFDRRAMVSDWFENWKFGRFALATHVIGCSTPYFMPWFVAFMSSESVTRDVRCRPKFCRSSEHVRDRYCELSQPQICRSVHKRWCCGAVASSHAGVRCFHRCVGAICLVHAPGWKLFAGTDFWGKLRQRDLDCLFPRPPHCSSTVSA